MTDEAFRAKQLMRVEEPYYAISGSLPAAIACRGKEIQSTVTKEQISVKVREGECLIVPKLAPFRDQKLEYPL